VEFWLGTHEPSWLARVSIPLFVSHRRLARRRGLPRAKVAWALDSGGFTELSLHGGWRTSVDEYVDAVDRYREGIGSLAWAAPMDWMCEPVMLQTTGLTVRDHQERTVANFLDLRSQGPFIPVLQGWTIDDYEACLALYAEAGVDLSRQRLVGLGSVCRRQSTAQVEEIVRCLATHGLNLHGFGVKKTGLARYGAAISSADSMAWSYRARRSPPLPGCTHKSCSNCLRYALRWREEIIGIDTQLELTDRGS